MVFPSIYLRSLYFLLLSILVISCSKEVTRETISLGNAVKITYESDQDAAEELVYQWYFLAKPKTSRAFLLVDGSKAIFNPDIEGNFDILVSVVDAYGKEMDKVGYYYHVVKEAAPLSSTDELVADEVRQQADAIESVPEPNPDESVPDKTPDDSEIIPDSDPIPDPAEVQLAEEKLDSVPAVPDEEVGEQIEIQVTDSDTVEEIDEPAPASFTIQVSAWKKKQNAELELETLNRNGFTGHIEQHYDPEKDQLWYRVRLDRYANQKSARTVLEKLNQIEGINAILVPLYE